MKFNIELSIQSIASNMNTISLRLLYGKIKSPIIKPFKNILC